MNFVEILTHSAWAGLASFGFALLFNVPTRTLLPCALAGALGFMLRATLRDAGVALEVATLAGASLVGFLALRFAGKWNAPTPVFSVPGVIPMVPGKLAYSAMLGFVRVATGAVQGPAAHEMLLDAISKAIQVGLVVGAVAFGIALPTLLLRRRVRLG